MASNKIVSDLLQSIEFSIDKFHNAAPGIQDRLYRRFLNVLKELSLTSSGNIKPTVKNLRLINTISRDFRVEIIQSNWVDRIADLENDLDKIQALQVKYFATIERGYKPSAFMNEIKRQTIISLKEKLLDDGLQANVVNRLSDILRKNITESASFSDLVDDMSVFLKGNSSRLGRLQSYSSQIVTDGLNQYAASLNKAFTDDLGLKWYRYVGSIVKDSRPWCVALVAKQWVHESELSKVSNGYISGVKVSLQGLIPGTDASNIQINRGGYNCNHMLLPVSSEVVPKDIRSKFE